MNYSTFSLIGRLLYYAINGASILCGLLVLFAFCKLRESTNLALKLILVLTSFDFGMSITKIFGTMFITDEASCLSVSLARVFFERASLIWSFSMSLIAFLVLRNFRRNLNRLFRNVLFCCIVAAVGISSMYVFKPFGIAFRYRDTTDPLVEKCIESSEGVPIANQLIFYAINKGLPYLFAIIITCVAYRKAGKSSSDGESSLVEATKSEGSKLLKYPLTQLILYSPVIIYSLMVVLDASHFSSEFVKYFKSVCSLSGFFTFMIYRKQTNQNKNLMLTQIQISMQQKTDDSLGISFETSDGQH